MARAQAKASLDKKKATEQDAREWEEMSQAKGRSRRPFGGCLLGCCLVRPPADWRGHEAHRRRRRAAERAGRTTRTDFAPRIHKSGPLTNGPPIIYPRMPRGIHAQAKECIMYIPAIYLCTAMYLRVLSTATVISCGLHIFVYIYPINLIMINIG